VLSLRFELQSSQIRFDSLGIDHLRLYLDGEAAVVSALREALATRVVGLMPQFDEIDPWGPALTGAVCNAPALPRLAGFGEDEALLELDARSHPAYRLLTEYFGFPEKFSFIDLPWPRSALVGSARRSFTLHVLFAQIHGDSDQSRLMEGVVPRQLVMSCAPVVNLFTQHADPIRMTHQRTAYPLVVDARHAFAHEVYSIDKVYHVQQTPQGESVAEFQPLYSLHHATLDEGGRYWYAHRDESMAQHSPGHELQLSIVDDDFDPVEPQSDTLSVEVTATNRDLPTLLGSGHPSGDLSMDGGSVAQAIRLLRKPTPSTRFQRGRGTLWRLISHLSVNHLSLASGGVDALREMLRLYELNRGGGTRRQVDGIKALEYRPATAWLPGQPFATFVRGVEVRMTLEEEAFVGSGLAVFVQVMDRFFGLCVNTNCFTRLVVLSADSGEELFKCAPRSGDSPLL
jgi:type VI secretion system protein ImpG